MKKATLATILAFGGSVALADGLAAQLNYITCPLNGHRYALTAPMTWTQAEALAVSEGGHLATIRSQAENDWVATTFSAGYPYIWIGYNDALMEGLWEWSSGEQSPFTNWKAGEPNNIGNEDYCLMSLDWSATWADLHNTASFAGYPIRGVVELGVMGRSDEIGSTRLQTTATPSSTHHFALADRSGGGCILFGGDTPTGPFFATYELDGTDWAKQFPGSSPGLRADHALILDQARASNLMFGGRNPAGVRLGDTWTYTAGQWGLLQPVHAPSPRSGHAMAYDRGSNAVLLFGGEGASGAALNDMWSWDGTDWTQLSPVSVPPARYGHGMAFDGVRGRVVLFGGSDGTARLQDVWEWDGSNWAEISPAQPNGYYWGPTVRESFAMVYDPRAQRVLVHGGETDQGCASDFWSWDGVEWTLHLPTGVAPSARSGHAMFFDPAVGELRLFGGACGATFSNELWKLELPVFHRYSTYGAGCAGTVGVPSLVAQAGTRPVVGETFIADLTNIPTSPGAVAFGLLGFSKDGLGGAPLPLDLAPIGMPGCSLLTSSEETTTLPNFGGRATMPLPVTPSLVGYTLYLQCAVLDRGANYQGIIMSNGLEFRIGDR